MVTVLIGLLRVSELKYKTAERREKRKEAKQERCAGVSGNAAYAGPSGTEHDGLPVF